MGACYSAIEPRQTNMQRCVAFSRTRLPHFKERPGIRLDRPVSALALSSMPPSGGAASMRVAHGAGRRFSIRSAPSTGWTFLCEQPQSRQGSKLPIAVEEDRAEALLVGLVREAAREVVRGAVYPVTAARRLQRTGDESTFRLVTSIAMPTSVSLEALAKACDLAADKIPPAFSLDLVGTERVPLAEARQLLGSGEQTIVLSGRSRVLNDVHELRFVVRSKGVDWHMPVAIPGGDELDESQPWVFVERDDVWVLAGSSAAWRLIGS